MEKERGLHTRSSCCDGALTFGLLICCVSELCGGTIPPVAYVSTARYPSGRHAHNDYDFGNEFEARWWLARCCPRA